MSSPTLDAYLLTYYLLTYLLNYSLTCGRQERPAPSTYLLTYSLTYLHTYLLTYDLHANILAYLLKPHVLLSSMCSCPPRSRTYLPIYLLANLLLCSHTITCHTGAHSHANAQPAHSLGAREKAPLPKGCQCAEAFLRAVPLVKVYLHNYLLT